MSALPTPGGEDVNSQLFRSRAPQRYSSERPPNANPANGYPTSGSNNGQDGDEKKGLKRAWTQKDQDEADKKEKQKAEEKLVQSWMDRLQLISVITTFFASTEAQLLSITTPQPGNDANAASQVANAGLAGALVLHSFSAIIAFLAAFVLIRFRIKEAKKDEAKASDAEKSQSTSSNDGDIWSSDPHIERVGPGMWPLRRSSSNRPPPTQLLGKCNTLCVYMAAVGFVMAAIGILSFTWSQLPKSVAIFSSSCLGACVVACSYLFF